MTANLKTREETGGASKYGGVELNEGDEVYVTMVEAYLEDPGWYGTFKP